MAGFGRSVLASAEDLHADRAALSATVFLIVYSLTDNLDVAIGLAVVVSIAQVTIGKVRGQRVEPMQWLVLGLVLALGIATLISKESRFFMISFGLIGAKFVAFFKYGLMRWPAMKKLCAAASQTV